MTLERRRTIGRWLVVMGIMAACVCYVVDFNVEFDVAFDARQPPHTHWWHIAAMACGALVGLGFALIWIPFRDPSALRAPTARIRPSRTPRA